MGAEDIHLVIVFEEEGPIGGIDFGVVIFGLDDVFVELNFFVFHFDLLMLFFLEGFISLHRC